MIHSRTSVSTAIHVLIALASTSAHALNEAVPEVLYQPTTSPSRAAQVSSANTITGCNAGLITLDGVYTCRSNAYVSKGGIIPDPVPVVVPPSVVTGGGGGNAWGGGGGDWQAPSSPPAQQMNYVGYDLSGNSTFAGQESDTTGGKSGGSSGGGGGRVICTHFYANGEIPQDVWRADLAFTKVNLSETTVRAYHAWAIGYVRLMRKSKMAEDIMRPLALHRAQELAYQMGVVEKGSWRGKLVRMAFEPLCFAIGTCVGASDYMALWRDQPHGLKLLGARA